MNNRQQGWTVQLADGREFHEEVGPSAPGELSSWQMLLERCRLENLRITHLSLVKAGVTVYALPRCEGYFQGREARTSNHDHRTRVVQGIGSILGDTVFINWVDERGVVSQEVRSLRDVWVHTTQRVLVDVLTPRA